MIVKVSKKEIELLIEKLQNCVDEMDDKNVDEISTNCNTYGMNKFISFGYSGYLSLDNDYIEVYGDDDDYE